METQMGDVRNGTSLSEQGAPRALHPTAEERSTVGPTAGLAVRLPHRASRPVGRVRRRNYPQHGPATNLTVKTIRPAFVAQVGGIDISRPLSEDVRRALWEVIDAYAVLVFRGQKLTDTEQIAFAEIFGQPERYVFSYSSAVKLRLKRPEMADISNLDATTGKPQTGSARHRMVNLGNRLWHTDSSFRLPRGGFSLLYAHVVPPPGSFGAGETEFADTCAAYDSLPPERQAILEKLQAEHSLMHSRAILGFTNFAAEERAALPPVAQPLVLMDRRTGRKSVYVASHASHILDMEVADGRLLLMELIERAIRATSTYRHEWQVGDLVMWDNRRSLHRGLPFDETYPRDLRRVTTSDGTEPARGTPKAAGLMGAIVQSGPK
jgi:alpha-ketoglutarate-dependent 2,4-dichlorophenoxyacetate dioxygenase